MITWLICVWLLRYKKGLILAPSSPLGKSCHAVIYFRKKKRESRTFKAVVSFFHILHVFDLREFPAVHSPNPFYTNLTHKPWIKPPFNTPPAPTPSKNPTTPPWLVKTYVKSYFPLIKYSSVLQMYAWITCHTLSLLRMAPRWCS